MSDNQLDLKLDVKEFRNEHIVYIATNIENKKSYIGCTERTLMLESLNMRAMH